MNDVLKAIFQKDRRPAELILVKEGSLGLETYYNEEVAKMQGPYKKQLIQFLHGIIKELE